MAEVELVLDRRAVEDYVRDAKLALVNATAYVVMVALFSALRVVLDVPYLRASVGLFLAASFAGVSVKRWLVIRRGTPWLVGAAAAGLVANLLVMVALVDANRGTLFANAGAALVGFAAVHAVDRIALARA